jgi:hypothetical protein
LERVYGFDRVTILEPNIHAASERWLGKTEHRDRWRISSELA